MSAGARERFGHLHPELSMEEEDRPLLSFVTLLRQSFPFYWEAGGPFPFFTTE
jgi:hypothetical protein